MEDKNKRAKKQKQKEIVVILHNIRSAQNVGSIFRTADAAGISKIFLTGTSPSPVDRFGRKRKDIAKTALGAEDYVAWEYAPNIGRLIARLKKERYAVVAVEQARGALEYTRIRFPKKTAFIFGNEVAGLPPRMLKKCDSVIEIPMRGRKESLNVAVAAGIILFLVARN